MQCVHLSCVPANGVNGPTLTVTTLRDSLTPGDDDGSLEKMLKQSISKVARAVGCSSVDDLWLSANSAGTVCLPLELVNKLLMAGDPMLSPGADGTPIVYYRALGAAQVGMGF